MSPADPNDPTGLKAVEAVAGLIAAGVLVVGVGLALTRLIVPLVDHGTGLEAATGPQWWRVAVQVGGGVAAEGAWQWRRRLPVPGRIGLAAGLIGGLLLVLAVCWWI